MPGGRSGGVVYARFTIAVWPDANQGHVLPSTWQLVTQRRRYTHTPNEPRWSISCETGSL